VIRIQIDLSVNQSARECQIIERNEILCAVQGSSADEMLFDCVWPEHFAVLSIISAEGRQSCLWSGLTLPPWNMLLVALSARGSAYRCALRSGISFSLCSKCFASRTRVNQTLLKQGFI